MKLTTVYLSHKKKNNHECFETLLFNVKLEIHMMSHKCNSKDLLICSRNHSCEKYFNRGPVSAIYILHLVDEIYSIFLLKTWDLLYMCKSRHIFLKESFIKNCFTIRVTLFLNSRREEH